MISVSGLLGKLTIWVGYFPSPGLAGVTDVWTAAPFYIILIVFPTIYRIISAWPCLITQSSLYICLFPTRVNVDGLPPVVQKPRISNKEFLVKVRRVRTVGGTHLYIILLFSRPDHCQCISNFAQHLTDVADINYFSCTIMSIKGLLIQKYTLNCNFP